MPTLKELLESNDLGAGEVKTASVNSSADLDGMDKLAMQLGLFGETTKVAAEDEEKEEAAEEKEEEEKKASAFDGSLHSMLFPGSDLAGAQEKTATEKQASAEQAMGAAAYDQFASAFDSFIEKLAYEALAGNPHADVQAVNHLPNNKPAGAKESIDSTPVVTDEVKAKNDSKQVGHVEQTQVKAASAFRKQLLLSVLEQ